MPWAVNACILVQLWQAGSRAGMCCERQCNTQCWRSSYQEPAVQAAHTTRLELSVPSSHCYRRMQHHPNVCSHDAYSHWPQCPLLACSVGVGFAIPSDTVARVVPQLIERGSVVRPSLGVVVSKPKHLCYMDLVPYFLHGRMGPHAWLHMEHGGQSTSTQRQPMVLISAI